MKENLTEITKSVIAIAIVLGAIVSLFFPEANEIAVRSLQSVGTLVIGFYFGGKTTPFAGLSLGKKK